MEVLEKVPEPSTASPTDPEEEENDDEGMQKMKRKNVPNSLTATQEQTVVVWFSEHSIFFGHNERDFKNRSKRDKQLTEHPGFHRREVGKVPSASLSSP